VAEEWYAAACERDAYRDTLRIPYRRSSVVIWLPKPNHHTRTMVATTRRAGPALELHTGAPGGHPDLAEKLADTPIALLDSADKLLGQVADLPGQRGQVAIAAGSAIAASGLRRITALHPGTLASSSATSSPLPSLALLARDPVVVRSDRPRRGLPLVGDLGKRLSLRLTPG